MIIFLYGPDDYRREAKKREIVAEFRSRRTDLGVGRFDFSVEGAFETFSEFLKNQSLFQSAKMAVLENSFDPSLAKATEGRDFINQLKGILDNKDVTVLMSEKEKPVKALDFLLKKPALAQEFGFLEGREWEAFILKEAKRLDAKITPTALRFLVSVYQNNTWGLVTELEKVAGLSKEVIDVKDLEDLGVAQAPNFWSLILSLKSQSLPQKLLALEKVLESNEPPVKVFNILAYQLPDKLQMLANYDLMVKSGKLEYEEALLDLAIN